MAPMTLSDLAGTPQSVKFVTPVCHNPGCSGSHGRVVVNSFVIESWKSGNKPVDDSGNYVHIVGRSAGLLAALLSLLRVDPRTRIAIGIERLEYKRSTLAGTQSRMIPLESISSAFYGYHKPWRECVAILALFGAVAASLLQDPTGKPIAIGVMLAGAVFATVHYLFNRTLVLGFIEHSGVISGIQFKRTVVDGESIDEGAARQICKVVQRLLEARQRRLATPPPQRLAA